MTVSGLKNWITLTFWVSNARTPRMASSGQLPRTVELRHIGWLTGTSTMGKILAVVPTAVVLAVLAAASAELCAGVILTDYGLSIDGISLLGGAALLIAMIIWSYFTAAFRTSFAKDYELSPEDPPDAASDRRAFVTVKRSTGAPRWCTKCNVPKPDRCHHCRQCGTCVLRMDHHCPWILHRCIGHRNYKAFFLLLVYGLLFCLYSATVATAAIMRAIREGEPLRVPCIALLFTSVVVLVVLVPFAIFHVYLITHNRTTLEYMEGFSHVKQNMPQQDARSRLGALSRGKGQGQSPSTLERKFQTLASRHSMYDVGALTNWRQVMGRNCWLWPLPLGEPCVFMLTSDTDGIHYPVDQRAFGMLQGVLEEAQG